MRGTTHIVGGVIAAELVCMVMHIPDVQTASVVAGAAVLGSIMPDIDQPRSKISNRNIATRVIGTSTHLVLGHRGVTHTIIFGAVLSAILYFAVNFFPELLIKYTQCDAVSMITALSFMAGYLSHLILDTFNAGGIMWLWPFSSRKYHVAEIRSGGIVDTIIIAVALAVIAIALGTTLLDIHFIGV